MMMHRFEQKVEYFIQEQALLNPGDRVLVALSGGPDSVALLVCLMGLREKWGWDLAIAHVDHGLRGKESTGDAEFVRYLGETCKIPTVVRNISAQKFEARSRKTSFQAYARVMRYQILREIALDLGATKIALGHQADDQAETVLMWMVRGSGTGGLGGMSPMRDGTIVRPLLDRTKTEILEYLQSKKMAFRTDSSNAKPLYLRNRIRQKLIPLLQEFSPGIVRVLSRQSHILRADHALLEHMADQAFNTHCQVASKGVVVSRDRLLGLPLPIQRRVLRLCVQRVLASVHWPRFDMIQRVLDQLAMGHSGWMVECHGVCVSLEQGMVVIQALESARNLDVSGANGQPCRLSIPGEVVWASTGQKIWLSDSTDESQPDSSHLFKAHLDKSTFSTPLTVRSWLPGDLFYPKGLGGKRKKLQDFFSDIKIPRSQRPLVPLLVAPEGIVCVGAFRADERFRVTAETTSTVVAQISTTTVSQYD